MMFSFPKVMLGIVGVVVGMLLPFSSYAQTLTAANAKVTLIESSYLPHSVYLQLDQDVGNCPAGAWVYFVSNHADSNQRDRAVQGNLGVLLTAFSTDSTVRVHVYLENEPCRIRHLYIQK